MKIEYEQYDDELAPSCYESAPHIRIKLPTDYDGKIDVGPSPVNESYTFVPARPTDLSDYLSSIRQGAVAQINLVLLGSDMSVECTVCNLCPAIFCPKCEIMRCKHCSCDHDLVQPPWTMFCSRCSTMYCPGLWLQEEKATLCPNCHTETDEEKLTVMMDYDYDNMGSLADWVPYQAFFYGQPSGYPDGFVLYNINRNSPKYHQFALCIVDDHGRRGIYRINYNEFKNYIAKGSLEQFVFDLGGSVDFG